jgi:hypothetical protein
LMKSYLRKTSTGEIPSKWQLLIKQEHLLPLRRG